jgi:catechol 2,3-dioxygenase-like lactoylglutathione lyase family enzyme
MHTKMRMLPTLPASDLDRARRYYRDTLGFEIQREGFDGIVFRSGDASFLVYKTEAPRGGNTAATFMTDDFDGEVGEFRRRGIKFEEYPQLPDTTWEDGVATYQGVRTFWFTDSEGNILAVGDWPAMERQLSKAA